MKNNLKEVDQNDWENVTFVDFKQKIVFDESYETIVLKIDDLITWMEKDFTEYIAVIKTFFDKKSEIMNLPGYEDKQVNNYINEINSWKRNLIADIAYLRGISLVWRWEDTLTKEELEIAIKMVKLYEEYKNTLNHRVSIFESIKWKILSITSLGEKYLWEEEIIVKVSDLPKLFLTKLDGLSQYNMHNLMKIFSRVHFKEAKWSAKKESISG